MISFCLKILQPYVLFMERSFASRWYLYRFLTGKWQVQADFFPELLSVVWQSVFTDLANQFPQNLWLYILLDFYPTSPPDSVHSVPFLIVLYNVLPQCFNLCTILSLSFSFRRQWVNLALLYLTVDVSQTPPLSLSFLYGETWQQNN